MASRMSTWGLILAMALLGSASLAADSLPEPLAKDRYLLTLDAPGLLSVRRGGGDTDPAVHAARIAARQLAVERELRQLGGTALGRMRNLRAAVIVEISEERRARLERLPHVVDVSPVRNYRLQLGETVPYIGAGDAHASGFTGDGVKIAIIDSGIDFTHRAFGGPGTESAWEEAYYGNDPACTSGSEPACANAQPPDPSLFGPGAPKVKGGHDYIGEQWDGSSGSPPEEPDENPIDAQGHGTHVADIAAGFGYESGVDDDGVSYPEKGSGVAPDADLWAFKACSAVSPACSGSALLQALDDAMDLDGDPGTDDPVDVINLSLGASYGQPESSLWDAVNDAAAAGAVVVAAAGNDGDRPYVVASPAAAEGAIAVAQLTVPSAELSWIETGGAADPVDGIRQVWSADHTTPVSGPLAYVTDSQATRWGCSDGSGASPFAPGQLDGQVVIMDRGGCATSFKVANAAAAGAVLALLADWDEASPVDLPPSYAYGGGDASIPGYSLTLEGGEELKALAGTTATVDPASDDGIADTVERTSSRGPRNNDNRIKPDIAAPGASVSATVGTGSQTEAFGGTSGAAPMVAGAAALLVEAFGDGLTPAEVRSLLMNTAETTLYVDGPPSADGGYPAPVARVGGGRVEVDESLDSPLVAWDDTTGDGLEATGSLSFSYQPVVDTYQADRTLAIRNLSDTSQSVDLSSAFRDAADQGQGVTVEPLSSSVTVPAEGRTDVTIRLTIDAAGLREGGFDKGRGGSSGYPLDEIEVDGWIQLTTAGGASLSVPWHVLPRKVADVTPSVDQTAGPDRTGTVTLTNAAPHATSHTEVFSLVEQSADLYGFEVGSCASLGLDPGCDETAIDLKEVGVRHRSVDVDGDGTVEPLLEFAISVWDLPYRASLFPAEFRVRLDTDQDGELDQMVYNRYGTQGLWGRSLIKVYDEAADEARWIGLYADTDYDTQTWILPVPLAEIGLGEGQAFDFYVESVDFYFTGDLYDCSPYPGDLGNCGSQRHTVTVGEPRFQVDESDLALEIPPGGAREVPYLATESSSAASPDEDGLLFFYREAPLQRESDPVALVTAEDGDGDGRADADDCAPDNPGAFAVPPEVSNLALSADGMTITWDSVAPSAGAATVYDLHREGESGQNVGQDPDGVCAADDVAAEQVDDATEPTPGEALRYLVRAQNACGAGSWGSDSSGFERSAGSCP